MALNEGSARASNKVVPGPIAQNVIANVRRLRARSGLTLVELSEKLGKVGHPILPTGLQRLEAGKRRVDPDDLVGLAVALEVAPISLLLPHVDEGQVQLTDSMSVDVEHAWDWARAKEPLGGRDNPMTLVEHQQRSLPAVAGRKYDLLTDAGKLAFLEDHPNKLTEIFPDRAT